MKRQFANSRDASEIRPGCHAIRTWVLPATEDFCPLEANLKDGLKSNVKRSQARAKHTN